MNIGFLGCGNMGGAILAALMESENFSDDIIISNRDVKRNKELFEKYNIEATEGVEELASCEIVILAIKPQGLKTLVFEPKEGTIIISILAGTLVSQLREKFPMARIVRTMPNLGQLVGKGMTGILFDPDSGFEEEERTRVEEIFLAGGKVLMLDTEEKIDWIGAISGSGPAYFFLFAEYLAKAAIDLGFTEEEAEVLARQTLTGASEVIDQSPETSLTEWKKRVMSPGGTTEQAIASFDKSKLDIIISRAVKAAMKQTKELAAS